MKSLEVSDELYHDQTARKTTIRAAPFSVPLHLKPGSVFACEDPQKPTPCTQHDLVHECILITFSVSKDTVM